VAVQFCGIAPTSSRTFVAGLAEIAVDRFRGGRDFMGRGRLMLSPSNLRLFLCSQATDMRKSFDGLSGVVRQFLSHDPTSGQVFVFFNKRRDQVKALWWDDSGYAIWHKRLEAGSFHPCSLQGQISHAELVMILEGIQVKELRKYKRFNLAEKCSESSI